MAGITRNGGNGPDSLVGTQDDDTLRGNGGDDTLRGLDGADSLDGGNGNDSIAGGDGDDTLDGGDNDDTLKGDGGADSITGVNGADSISGGAGDDTLKGGSQDDTIGGGADDDSIEGGSGDDLIGGGAGNDSLTGDDGEDTIYGEGGDDFIDESFDGSRNRLDGGDGQDAILGGSLEDTICGGDGDDFIDAGTGGDHVDGGAGDDTIIAGGGSDYVDGGTGDDNITFGGYDGGNDTIAFDVGGGTDTVLGWNPQEDLIHIGDLTQDDITLTQVSPKIWQISVDGGDPDDVLTLDYDFFWNQNLTEDDLRARILTSADEPRPEKPDVADPPCFTPGVRILTTDGLVRVEHLIPGQMVVTRDHGPLPLQRLLETTIDPTVMSDMPNLRPVVFPAGSIAPGIPPRRMRVSPQHGILLSLPSGPAVIRARHIVEHANIGHRQRAPSQPVRYLHLLLERHALVQADGIWSESFYPGPQTLFGRRILSEVTDQKRDPLPWPYLKRRDVRALTSSDLRRALGDGLTSENDDATASLQRI
ncbi:hypothetical protein JANAI62_00450 [Jannaschia pagri]|uniref:Hedgehog/Intein (Hint) domain-containing protein n=1 Tax=Jannaschia pagri TaxID=2829797 RepID=A0ABQ4NG84_9RHOB|nr:MULTISPECIES: Hint domain-containing protein [unclassified Jannaschia]GIT90473.1 hypothetical protein JANAI61_09310 [Jannaschia sp. AI_61]GIT93422.1 hypothetical protein JANAI62_00450 [Jannaschia sp. AI_62]